MLQSEFEEFVNSHKSRLKGVSDSEKVKIFIDWCTKYDLDELIIRLSGDGKGPLEASYFLDFMTRGLLIHKKVWSRKLVDHGFIAGMAPLLYRLLSDELKSKDFSKRTLAQTSDLMKYRKESATKYILYPQIQVIALRPGLETGITNMFGSTLRQNFITIKTIDKKYRYSLSVAKNGAYEKIYHWLSTTLPVKISPF